MVGTTKAPTQEPQSTPTSMPTGTETQNPNAGLGIPTYQAEQQAINSTGTPFMNYAMWKAGTTAAPVIPSSVLEPIVQHASAPDNDSAPNNRLLDGGMIAGLGALMQRVPHWAPRLLGTGAQMLGSAHVGGEAVARHQAAQTEVIDDPGLTTDQAQIERDYAKLPAQYHKHGYGPQGDVVKVLRPTRKNARGSSAIQRSLLHGEEPLFRSTHAPSNEKQSPDTE